MTAPVQAVPAPAARRSQHLRYEPALDGVRALAVLAVMVYHFGQGWLPGGYIGVDVFFVLSGYLITTLLVQNLPEPVRARTFWERRARRLFPALAVMLLAVFGYALTVPALEQAAIRGQGIATVLYVNNWWLLHSGTQYFDAYQQFSPLLHTWTLSVEEQWYLLFPLLLLLLVALRRFRWRWVFALVAVLCASSVLWTAWLASHGAPVDRLYLGTDTRAQQLLLGALLGILGVRQVAAGRARFGYVPAVGVIGLLGLLGVVVMFAVWPQGRWVPAQLALAAVFSAMLIAGAGSATAVTRLLRVEPLRRIGLISYGLYLWHWPIAVMIGPDQTNAPTVVRLLLTFLAAAVSYLVVERPVRAGGGNIKVLLVLPLVLVALAVLCTPKAADTRYLRGLPEHAAPDYRGEGTTTFVLGDSVSASLWLPAATTPPPGIAVTGSFLLGCPLFGMQFVADGQHVVQPPPGTDCAGWEGQWREDMAQRQPAVGVLVGTSSWQFDVVDSDGAVQPFGSPGYARVVTQALDETFADFSADRIAITSVPCTALPPNVINDSKNDRDRTRVLNDFLRGYARAHGYGFIDLGDVTCAPDVSGLYVDGLHYNPEAALQIWQVLGPQIAEFARSAPTMTT